MKEILKLSHLYKEYGIRGFRTQVLKDISLTVDEGEFIAIMGPSGSGKTTLLNLLSTIDKPTKGEILLNGKDITRLRNKELSQLRKDHIGFIFQDYNLIPSLNVWENVVLPMGLDGRKVKKEDVLKILEQIGLEDKVEAMPNTLSGG